jgi:hypothetical protein
VRAPGGQMGGAAPLRAATRRPASVVARPLHITVCSSLAPRQRAWGPAVKCNLYSLTGPNLEMAKKMVSGLNCTIYRYLVQFKPDTIFSAIFFI